MSRAPVARVVGPVTALAASVVTVLAVWALVGHVYVTAHLRYPLGWDSGFYIWRTKAIAVDGLARVGTIRAVFPVFAATIGRLTGQSAWTVVALLPGVLAGLSALAAAGLVRAAFPIGAPWVPVIGFLTWAAFVSNEIPLHHFDNLTNVVLVLAGLAAAVAFAGAGRGTVATGALFAVGALAHWPFYLVAMAVFGLALVLFALPSVLAPRGGPRIPPAIYPLAGAGLASALVAGLSILGRPPSGWSGADPGTLHSLLRTRMLARLRRPALFAAYPVALAGAAGAALTRGRRAGRAEVRLFLCIVVAWAVVTLLAVLAQLAGLPTAGARILSFFLPASILTGLAAWLVGTWVARRLPPGLGAAGAVAVGLVAVLGFGIPAWHSWSGRHPWFEPAGLREASAAGAYADLAAPGREVVFLLEAASPRDLMTVGRWWTDVKAALPPDVAARAHLYVGSPPAYAAHRPSIALGAAVPPGESATADPLVWGAPGAPPPLVLVLERYNAAGYRTLVAEGGARRVARGVLVADGAPSAGAPSATGSASATAASTGLGTVLLLVAATLAGTWAAGGGWALVLLPADALLRVLLAPALGLAAVSAIALAWTGLAGSLSLSGAIASLLVPVALGWAAAGIPLRRRWGRAPTTVGA